MSRIHYFVTVDSTMRVASGLPVGDVVVANEQTAGQGRHGHYWHSEPDTGLYCSIVLKPQPLLTLALGLAAAETVGLGCDLRWPNDVLIGGRKTAGVLVQLVEDRAVAGIGINVNNTSFPPELEATSMRLHAGHPLDKHEILNVLLRSVNAFTALGPDDILRLFTRSSSYALGRRVDVHLPEGLVHGVTRGLTPDGFLVVRQDDGTDTLIVAGGVRAARS